MVAEIQDEINPFTSQSESAFVPMTDTSGAFRWTVAEGVTVPSYAFDTTSTAYDLRKQELIAGGCNANSLRECMVRNRVVVHDAATVQAVSTVAGIPKMTCLETGDL